MGKKITQYPNNVSTNPDNLSLLDLSEKTGASTFESRKWNLTAFKAWVNSWVVAGAVAWNDITGKPNVVDTTGGTANYVAKFTDTDTIEESQIYDAGYNIGIGSTTPSSAISGTARVVAINDNVGTNVSSYRAYGGNALTSIELFGAPSYVGLYGSTDTPMTFSTNASERMRISSNGNVGIGTTTPDAKLHITNTLTVDSFKVFDEDLDTTMFVIDDSGSVGVGTTTNSTMKFYVYSLDKTYSAYSLNLLNGGTGVFGITNADGSNTNYGVTGKAQGSTIKNVGVYGVANVLAGGKNIGGMFSAENGFENHAVQLLDSSVGEGKFLKCTTTDGHANWDYLPKVVQLAVSDETTALTTGTAKITFRMPHAMTLTEVRASLTTAQTSGNIVQVDINEGGTSILSTKITLDNGEKTSKTALTPPVLSDTSLGDDSEITVDIDQLGDGTAKGLKITLIGY